MVVAALGSVAGDLAQGVNGIGVNQHPAGVGGDPIVQVLHAAGGCPEHGMRGIVPYISVANYLVAVVDAEGDAVSAARESA